MDLRKSLNSNGAVLLITIFHSSYRAVKACYDPSPLPPRSSFLQFMRRFYKFRAKTVLK